MNHLKNFNSFLNENEIDESKYWPIDSLLKRLPGVKVYLKSMESQIKQMSPTEREEFVKKLSEVKRKKNIDSWTTALIGSVSSYIVFPAFVSPILVFYFIVTLLRDFKFDEVKSYSEKLSEMEEDLRKEIEKEKNNIE